jgi:sec-independent protein translocase protein TatA
MPFFGNLGTTEWIIIGLVVIFIFGSSRLKQLARGLGESGKELKKVKKEFKAAVEDDMNDYALDEKQGHKHKKKEG